MPWTVVMPVQSASRAKSRLVAPAGVDHRELARAIALDTLDAVRACELVGRRVVVTSDPVVGPLASAAGDTVVMDAGAGLGGAVAAGLAHAAEHAPDLPVAVLLADLPSVTTDDVALALVAAAGYLSAFVPDAEGTGTVLLTGRTPGQLRAAFGEGSADRHRRLGAVRLDLDAPGLRRDVDTAESLDAAAALGLGRATTAALAGRLVPTASCVPAR
jgi:2-phospho-L-lactate guanylyltransferase